MILVEEAVQRFNNAGRPYGVAVRPWSRRAKQHRLIAEIEQAILPLKLPMELRSFWSAWDPSSVQWPCLDGFVPLKHVLERQDLSRPLSPAILLPFADWSRSRIWIELGSASHPGGRIFRGDSDQSYVDLWAFGVSELLDMLSTAFERDLIDERRGGLHQSHVEAVATKQVREYVSAASPRRVEALDRSSFPEHWLAAEGLTADHFALRGPTHTVEAFKAARATAGNVSATLTGYYENTICGGPIRGCIGTLVDDTGQIQVFVPLLSRLAGAMGWDGQVELDVIAFEPHGTELGELTARDDMQRAADMGVADLGNEVVLRLAEQMKELDTSIVVTGLRPVR